MLTDMFKLMVLQIVMSAHFHYFDLIGLIKT